MIAKRDKKVWRVPLKPHQIASIAALQTQQKPARKHREKSTEKKLVEAAQRLKAEAEDDIFAEVFKDSAKYFNAKEPTDKAVTKNKKRNLKRLVELHEKKITTPAFGARGRRRTVEIELILAALDDIRENGEPNSLAAWIRRMRDNEQIPMRLLKKGDSAKITDRYAKRILRDYWSVEGRKFFSKSK